MHINVFKMRAVWSVTILVFCAAFVLTGCQEAPSTSPNEMIRTGIKNLMEVTSGSYEMSLKVDITDNTPSSSKLNVSAAGIADRKDLKDLKFAVKLDGSFSGSAEGQESGGNASLELRLSKDAAFFNVAKVEVTGTEIPDSVKKYMSKWWKMTVPAEMQQEIQTSVPSATTQEMSDEQKQMNELIAATDFFKAEYKGMKDVKGESSYHYAVELDKEAAMDFLVKAKKIQGEEFTDDEKEELPESFAAFTLTGDIYVGAVSGVITEFDGTMKLDKSGPTESTGTVTVSLVLGGINKPVTLEEPAGAAEFPTNEFLSEMMGGSIPTGEASFDTTGAYEDVEYPSITDSVQ
jgi:hypothetical protein